MKQPLMIRAGGCVAALLFAGCGGGGVSRSSTATLPGAPELSSAITSGANHPVLNRSCIHKNCIYVSVYNQSDSAVSINAYPVSADGNVAPIWTISGPKTKLGAGRLTVDAARNVYAVDSSANGSILVYAAGTHGNVAPVRTISGSNTGLDYPIDVAVDAHGLIYVANADNDYSRYSVTVYAAGANGNVVPIQTISGSKTTFRLLTGIALDGQGNIYVGGDSNILVFAPGANGNVAPSRTIYNKWIFELNGIAVSTRGAIDVADVCVSYYCYVANEILWFPADANGNVHARRIVGSKTRLNGFTRAIARDPQGRIYIVDGETRSVRVYAARARGDVAPIQSIAGSETGFDTYPGPIGIVVH